MINTNESQNDVPTHRTETHNVHYDPGTPVAPSETLVIAIADVDDVDPLELEPLYDTVDPDVVNDFVESGGVPDVDGHVEFTFEGYDVTVHASGLFEIEPAD
jgi:hypothetical protein